MVQNKIAAKIKNKKQTVLKQNQALQKLQIEYLPIDMVKPNSYNPNVQDEHEFELLCQSIQEDGFTQPVIISTDNIIVDGEHRWRAGKALGYSEIPIVKVPMTAEQAKIATLRHNRARGSEDMELSALVLRDLQALGALDWAKDSLLLSDAEMEKILVDVDVTDMVNAEIDQFSPAYEPSTLGEGVGVAPVTHDRGGQETIIAASREVLSREELKKGINQDRKEYENTSKDVDVKETVTLSFKVTREQKTLIMTALGNKEPVERLISILKEQAILDRSVEAIPE